VKFDTHSRLFVDLESEMGTSVFYIKHKLKNHEATERSYVQCGTVSKQWKSLKYCWRNLNLLVLYINMCL